MREHLVGRMSAFIVWMEKGKPRWRVFWAKALVAKANDELLTSGILVPLYLEPTVVRERWMSCRKLPPDMILGQVPLVATFNA